MRVFGQAKYVNLPTQRPIFILCRIPSDFLHGYFLNSCSLQVPSVACRIVVALDNGNGYTY
jgi:hypothetical protein